MLLGSKQALEMMESLGFGDNRHSMRTQVLNGVINILNNTLNYISRSPNSYAISSYKVFRDIEILVNRDIDEYDNNLKKIIGKINDNISLLDSLGKQQRNEEDQLADYNLKEMFLVAIEDDIRARQQIKLQQINNLDYTLILNARTPSIGCYLVGFGLVAAALSLGTIPFPFCLGLAVPASGLTMAGAVCEAASIRNLYNSYLSNKSKINTHIEEYKKYENDVRTNFLKREFTQNLVENQEELIKSIKVQNSRFDELGRRLFKEMTSIKRLRLDMLFFKEDLSRNVHRSGQWKKEDGDQVQNQIKGLYASLVKIVKRHERTFTEADENLFANPGDTSMKKNN